MVHRVFICSNLTSPFGTTYCDKIDDCTNSNHVISSAFRSPSFGLSHQGQIQEGEHSSGSRTTTSASIHNLESRTTQSQEGENDENMPTIYETLVNMIKIKKKVEERTKNVQIELEAQSNSSSSLSWSPGPGHTNKS